MPHAAMDPSSLSNPHDVVVTHMALVLDVSFSRSILKGSVDLTCKVMREYPSKLVLDTSMLVIASIQINNAPTKWVQRPAVPLYGSALEISLPKKSKKGDTLKVLIQYSTSPRGSGLQWLPPAQTEGKRHPYLFTQCQAIYARSLLPCQDTPAVKTTYSASITVPEWAICLMSALRDPSSGGTVTNGRRTFKYNQPVPLSSYLIALAVGELESRELSSRCRVWAEASVVDLAASDFSQTEDFLKAAESLTCEYVWGRYDLLCLPASFPYGGMENPCLTFVTPTLLSGDKSLASVVAHEIAHSWSGNLVSNATWEHFWLNEGLTRWLEARIVAKATGDPGYVAFDGVLGWERLKEDVERYEATGMENLTALCPRLNGVDPDDNVTAVPYEKGMFLLNELERRVGVKEFGAFLKAYIQHFKFKTITTSQFKQYFVDHFHGAKALGQDWDWDAWLYGHGMPPVTPTFDDSLFRPCWDLAEAWLACSEESPAPADTQAAAFASWPWRRKVVMLDRLEEGTKKRGAPLPIATIEAMEAAYGLGTTRNAEMVFHWLLLCLRAGHWACVPRVLTFVKSYGRMKFARPLYRELAKYPQTKDQAIATFLANASFYHPICRAGLEKDLGVQAPQSAPGSADQDAAAAAAAAAAAEDDDGGSDGGKEAKGGGSGSLLLTLAGVVAVAAAVAIVVMRRGRVR